MLARRSSPGLARKRTPGYIRAKPPAKCREERRAGVARPRRHCARSYLRLLSACTALATVSAALSAPTSRRQLLSREDAVEHAAEHLDWPLVYHNVPWLTPPEQRFPYTGVTEMEQLTKLQSSNGWVTVFVYSKPTNRWALNLVYSLVQFASVNSYMAAALDKESLADCQSWQLPCLDASWAFNVSVGEPGKPATHRTPRFLEINWVKVKLLDRLLELNYNVHFTDNDLIYLRDAYRSYETLFQLFRMDGTFMREHPLNTGAFAIQANDRSRAFTKLWLAARTQAGGHNKSEQDGLHDVHGTAYVICETVNDCAEAKARSIMAIYRHELQFEETNCPSKMGYPCHPDRLFLHAVCMTYGVKSWWFKQERLWLVDLHGRPNFLSGPSQVQRFRWRRLAPLASQQQPAHDNDQPQEQTVGVSLAPHPHFPCREPAWSYLRRDVLFRAFHHENPTW